MSIGTEEHWNILLAITAVPALISAALWWFIPESPRYLFVLTHNGEAGIKGAFLQPKIRSKRVIEKLNFFFFFFFCGGGGEKNFADYVRSR